MELLDIFDKAYNYIGTCEKKQAHREGKWHQTFNCLFIDSTNNKVYLQYKNNSYNDLSSNNKIDISIGGHLIAGEKIENGIREIKEESSLDIKYSDLIYLGYRRIDLTINENYIIREFNHLHICDRSFVLKKLKSKDEEVLYFIEFDIDELFDFLNDKRTTIEGSTIHGKQTFTKDDFIKGYTDDKIYLNYLHLTKKMMNKEPKENYLWKEENLIK